MRVWIVCFFTLFGLAELYQWVKHFNLPLPVFILGGAFLAIISNGNKRVGLRPDPSPPIAPTPEPPLPNPIPAPEPPVSQGIASPFDQFRAPLTSPSQADAGNHNSRHPISFVIRRDH